MSSPYGQIVGTERKTVGTEQGNARQDGTESVFSGISLADPKSYAEQGSGVKISPLSRGTAQIGVTVRENKRDSAGNWDRTVRGGL